LSRSSNAATNSELCPPSEWPMTPIRSGSTSGRDWRKSTHRMWLKMPFIEPES
jgi:hypothetical protein